MNFFFSKIRIDSCSIFGRNRHAEGLSKTSVGLPKMTGLQKFKLHLYSEKLQKLQAWLWTALCKENPVPERIVQVHGGWEMPVPEKELQN